MRIVFFGTPDFAVASLSALVEQGFDVVGVVTATDKPVGRGHKLQFSAVKSFALEAGIPVLQPSNLKDAKFQDSLRVLKADLQIVVAFRMLPEAVWNMPPLGTYNLHASLLPDYRGAAPINWAIINGEKITGVTTFKLQHEIDTGNILFQESVEIGENETAGELYERLMKIGAKLLVKSVKAIDSSNIELQPQESNGEHNHAPKLFKENCKINLGNSCQDVHNFIRGLTPFPGAYLMIAFEDREEKWKLSNTKVTDTPCSGKKRFKIEGRRLLLSTIDYWLEVNGIQIPGKKKVDAQAFINGYKDSIDAIEIQ